MPLSRNVARFNRRYFNRVTLKIAGWMPGFGIVRHVGRTSGRSYRTPVNVFAADGGYVIALTYGAESDWVANVLAANGCELRTRGRDARLTSPRIVTDPRNRWAPLPARLILNRLRVTEHMRLDVAATE